MKFTRVFTTPDQHPFDTVAYEKRDCFIRNPDGSIVFEMRGIEVPKDWSQLATDILISKYLRRAGLPEAPHHEVSVKQTIGRITGTVRLAGEVQGGYFDSKEDADIFEQELTHVLLYQQGAFNSPVWFNLGLHAKYGIHGGGGNWHWDEQKGAVTQGTNNYEHPQCSACFIQSIEDDLMSIFGLVQNEARIFKYGSGTGTNFSNLRGRQEKLSGGGTSSGLMSFLEVFDRAAGATKSGGTTRRAAKMVCLDADHPEIRDFVGWKRIEEKKVRALIAQGYSSDFNGEAYHTVSGQNSNNSVRLPDAFMKACDENTEWQTRMRTTGEVCESFPARDLMREIGESAWECADPGVQFDTTINDWHTCAASGPIKASNPCSEFMFIDDTACNLASINLLKYVREDGSFDTDAYLHTIKLFITAQEILVDFSSYPTDRIAYNSHLYRPLGLGYANLGSLLMVKGLPYDGDSGRALAAALTAILTGYSYQVSAEIAAAKKPFAEYEKNSECMLRVIGKHLDAARKIPADQCPAEMRVAAIHAWEGALTAGRQHGFRNAQVSVLAPTGTIGLLMDCDTTGVEPDFALVKFKKLSGGGYFKIVNQSVRRALESLDYDEFQAKDIITYLIGTQKLDGARYVTVEALKRKGFNDSDLAKVESVLPGAFELEQAFSSFQLGEETLQRLGLEKKDYEKPDFNLLRHIGFTEEQITEDALTICGARTIEGAPHLEHGHYPVFDCAGKCGALGTRYIEPMGHIRMMAAVQPFISGAISKTVNLPNNTSVEEIERTYRTSWEMGLKAVAIYRDGCKVSQPLNTTGKDAKKTEEVAEETKIPAIAPVDGQLELFPEIAEYGPKQRPLPKRRRGMTVEARVGGHKVFLRTGEYEDGNLGEVFIDMHKEGSTFRSLMMCFAIAVSKGLQYGVPLREFVDTFTFTNFEPRGICDHANVKMASSVVDFVFRVLGMEYLGRTDLCQVKPEVVPDHTHPVAPQRQLPPTAKPAAATPVKSGDALDRQMQELGDAPFCDVCGHVTVRNGACYRCLNCGNSMGCS
ncbi:TPA: vitamin B12-dependent ribonucleotide reductase [Candidatus Sumerlaeota bacterium]|jgi:ribonucleoside-diphosphate reductase alpha chain|nr:vitamin B12-dependent ribonucleotide reductase [Candidatus Sumerlaeota bacterium]